MAPVKASASRKWSSARRRTTLEIHRCSCGFCPKHAAVRASRFTASLRVCVKSASVRELGDKSELLQRSASPQLYLSTLLSLGLPSASPRSRTPSPVVRRNSAHNFFLSPSPSPSLSFLIHFSPSGSCLVSARPAAALRLLRRLSLSSIQQTHPIFL